jgi:carboxyl-terminal processing protease
LGRLQKKNDFTEISELIWRSGLRKRASAGGDLVMKVAQGNALAADVVGMRLDDVVKKLRDLRELKFVLP